ncbi:MAG TPA: hypothetical protein V6D03_12255, partial [Candidatus Caenarcaniphilales bacterium]
MSSLGAWVFGQGNSCRAPQTPDIARLWQTVSFQQFGKQEPDQVWVAEITSGLSAQGWKQPAYRFGLVL